VFESGHQSLGTDERADLPASSVITVSSAWPVLPSVNLGTTTDIEAAAGVLGAQPEARGRGRARASA